MTTATLSLIPGTTVRVASLTAEHVAVLALVDAGQARPGSQRIRHELHARRLLSHTYRGGRIGYRLTIPGRRVLEFFMGNGEP